MTLNKLFSAFFLMIVFCVVLALIGGRWTVCSVEAQPPSESTVALRLDDDEDNEDEDDEDEGEDRDEDEDEDSEADEWENELEQLERHRLNVELEMAEIETTFHGLEMVNRIAEIAESEVATAAMAVMHTPELFEDEEAAAKFLESALKDVENDAVRRIIRIKLAELYAEMDCPDRVRAELRSLITGK